MKNTYIKLIDIEDMCITGFLQSNDGDKIEVYVNTDDICETPHFHVRKYRPDGLLRWVVGIAFENAEYIFHEGCNDRFADDSIKGQLIRFLGQQNPYFKWTNWKVTVDMWNFNNDIYENSILDLDIQQPDYSKLK